jgi:ech hydrogenase subunit D
MTIAVEQTMETIPLDQLLEKVRGMRAAGQRLVHITATRLYEAVELTYGFDLDTKLTSFRIVLPPADARVPSISGIYPCSVLYENEVNDLFKVPVDGMAIDFKGNFYKTAVPFPFGSTKPPVPPAKPAAAKPATAKPAAAARPAAPATTPDTKPAAAAPAAAPTQPAPAAPAAPTQPEPGTVI